MWLREKRWIRDKGKESPERSKTGGKGKRLYRREV
jgi:hypothetical protein